MIKKTMKAILNWWEIIIFPLIGLGAWAIVQFYLAPMVRHGKYVVFPDGYIELLVYIVLSVGFGFFLHIERKKEKRNKRSE